MTSQWRPASSRVSSTSRSSPRSARSSTTTTHSMIRYVRCSGNFYKSLIYTSVNISVCRHDFIKNMKFSSQSSGSCRIHHRPCREEPRPVFLHEGPRGQRGGVCRLFHRKHPQVNFSHQLSGFMFLKDS